MTSAEPSFLPIFLSVDFIPVFNFYENILWLLSYFYPRSDYLGLLLCKSGDSPPSCGYLSWASFGFKTLTLILNLLLRFFTWMFCSSLRVEIAFTKPYAVSDISDKFYWIFRGAYGAFSGDITSSTSIVWGISFSGLCPGVDTSWTSLGGTIKDSESDLRNGFLFLVYFSGKGFSTSFSISFYS